MVVTGGPILRLRDGARKLLIRRGTDCSHQLNTSGNGFTLELFGANIPAESTKMVVCIYVWLVGG